MERHARNSGYTLHRRTAGMLLITAAFAQMLLAFSPAKALDTAGLAFVSRLQAYEQQAFKDYEFRHIDEAVINRSNELWDYHVELRRNGHAPPCSSAVRVLSQMVSGAYYASKRSEIPLDWFHFAPQYGEFRTACLEALNVPADTYALPSSFAR